MTVAPGLRPTDPAEPAATRALLAVLELTPPAAAALLGMSERELALVLAGHGHVAGPAANKRTGEGGAWGEMAGRLIDAVQARESGPDAPPANPPASDPASRRSG